MAIQARRVTHEYQSHQEQSVFDFYCQAVAESWEMSIAGEDKTDTFSSVGTVNGEGYRVRCDPPLPAETVLTVTFTPKDYVAEQDSSGDPPPSDPPGGTGPTGTGPLGDGPPADPPPSDPPADPPPAEDPPAGDPPADPPPAEEPPASEPPAEEPPADGAPSGGDGSPGTEPPAAEPPPTDGGGDAGEEEDKPAS